MQFFNPAPLTSGKGSLSSLRGRRQGKRDGECLEWSVQACMAKIVNVANWLLYFTTLFHKIEISFWCLLEMLHWLFYFWQFCWSRSLGLPSSRMFRYVQSLYSAHFIERDSACVPLKFGEREGKRTGTSESQRTDWSHASTVVLSSASESAVQFWHIGFKMKHWLWFRL